MEQNFWEQGNSVKVNFREHLNLFLRNKGTTLNFHREQGKFTPLASPGGPSEGTIAELNPIKEVSACSQML